MNRTCSSVTVLALILLLSFGTAAVHGQEVFSNGVNVAGSFVISNGFIQLGSLGYAQDDPETRHIAPSIGQMAGVEPDTGDRIDDNGDLLTLMPRILDLTNPTNLAFVIAASQMTAGSAIVITRQGSNLVISVASGSVGAAQLADGGVTSAKLAGGAVTAAKIAVGAVSSTELASASVGIAHLKQPEMDGRYVNAAGDTMTGALNMGGCDITGLDELRFANGTLAIGRGTTNDCRFIGTGAGSGNTGICVDGMGYRAALGNTGNCVAGLGGRAAEANTGPFVEAVGYGAAMANSAYFVSVMGHYAGASNAGWHLTGQGYQAGRDNLAYYVNAHGYNAGRMNLGTSGSFFGWSAGDENAGSNVTGMGTEAARNNAGSYCFFAGWRAGKANTNSNVIAIGENISGSGLLPRTAYLDGDLRLMNCNGKGGGNAIHFHSGPSIQAEATHLAFSAPARFDEGIAYVSAMGDLSMGVYTNCP